MAYYEISSTNLSMTKKYCSISRTKLNLKIHRIYRCPKQIYLDGPVLFFHADAKYPYYDGFKAILWINMCKTFSSIYKEAKVVAYLEVMAYLTESVMMILPFQVELPCHHGRVRAMDTGLERLNRYRLTCKNTSFDNRTPSWFSS
jgi:hypothetical protein